MAAQPKPPPRKLTPGEVNQVIEHMPFNRLLGVRCTRVHKDGITVEIPLRPDLMNGGGMLHGGVTASMADLAVGLALFQHFGGVRRIATVEMTVSYLRPVTLAKLVGRSKLVRVGERLAVGQVDLFDGKKNRVGVATATYMILG